MYTSYPKFRDEVIPSNIYNETWDSKLNIDSIF